MPSVNGLGEFKQARLVGLRHRFLFGGGPGQSGVRPASIRAQPRPNDRQQAG